MSEKFMAQVKSTITSDKEGWRDIELFTNGDTPEQVITFMNKTEKHCQVWRISPC